MSHWRRVRVRGESLRLHRMGWWWWWDEDVSLPWLLHVCLVQAASHTVREEHGNGSYRTFMVLILENCQKTRHARLAEVVLGCCASLHVGKGLTSNHVTKPALSQSFTH